MQKKLSVLLSAATINYLTPRLRSKFGERAFSYAGPAAWNRLQETIRQAQTQSLFKKFLKTSLFTFFSASEVIRHTCAIQIRLLLLLLLLQNFITVVTLLNFLGMLLYL